MMKETCWGLSLKNMIPITSGMQVPIADLFLLWNIPRAMRRCWPFPKQEEHAVNNTTPTTWKYNCVHALTTSSQPTLHHANGLLEVVVGRKKKLVENGKKSLWWQKRTTGEEVRCNQTYFKPVHANTLTITLSITKPTHLVPFVQQFAGWAFSGTQLWFQHLSPCNRALIYGQLLCVWLVSIPVQWVNDSKEHCWQANISGSDTCFPTLRSTLESRRVGVPMRQGLLS